MADERESDLHIRNGAVPPEQLEDAFAELGIDRIVVKGVPGAGGKIEIRTRVAALLARLGASGSISAGPSRPRLNATLWAHLDDPSIRVLLVDTDTDISATLEPELPEAAYDVLAALHLNTIETLGIVAYDLARNARVAVERYHGAAAAEDWLTGATSAHERVCSPHADPVSQSREDGGAVARHSGLRERIIASSHGRLAPSSGFPPRSPGLPNLSA